MPNSTINLTSWLHHMRHLMPPVGAVLVGAGSGDWANLLAGWEVDDVHFIEADERQNQGLRSGLLKNSTWRFHSALIWREAEEISFYQTSNPAESGTLPAEALAALWPNLQTRSREQRHAITLNCLLNDIQPPAPPNWLVVDCLPALTVIKGAGAWLSSCDVIVARVVLDDAMLPGMDARKSELDSYLDALGFRCVAIQEERHPAIGNALYVRDWNLRIRQFRKARAEQETLATERQQQVHQQLEQLAQELDLQIKRAAETAMQLEQLKLAKAGQEALAEKYHKQVQQLAEEREAQTKFADEKIKKLERDTGQQLEQLTLAKAEQEALAAKRHKRVQQLTEEREAQTKFADEKIKKLERDTGQQLEQLTLARAEQEALAAKRHQQVQQLTVELSQVRSKQKTDQKTTDKFINQNAGIDEFINDLSPFLYGRSITYVDVGACIGAVFLKLYQAESIKVREAHLYEPNPDNFEKLSENIKDSTTQSLHAYKIGLADTNATKQFSKAKTMTKAIERQIDSDSVTNMFQVSCLPLDELAKSFTDRHIDLLKIDVEGSEIAVLKGAHQLLNDQNIDVIYIEVGFNKNGTQQVYFGEVDALLQKYNYRCFKIYEQVNEWMRDSPLLRRCNMAYMSAKFAESNPYKISRELQSLRSQLKKNGNH